MRVRSQQIVTVFLGIVAAGLSLSAAGADSMGRRRLVVPKLAFEKYKLPNGLEVILHEDHRLPLVSIDLWYHVGPVNEERGRTGFAHLFEHMMFEGSEHVGEKAHIRYLESIGATDINGTTDFDRTNYFETVPSNQVEMGLWLESDRMGFLLEKLDRVRLTNQRDVVRNERRMGEGTPYSLGEEQMFHLVFPKDHPYYADVIGSHADIESARLNDVRDFHRRYYTPNNATIALAGDFDTAKLKPLLEKYFGPIPAGPEPEKVRKQDRELPGEQRAVVTDTVQLPRVSVGWLTPRAFEKGDAEADLVAQIMGVGNSSRLYRKLVYSDQLAQSVDCQNSSRALASMTICNVTGRPGVKPEALEAAFDKEWEQFRNSGPSTAEVDRARNMILSRKIEGLQRLGGFGGVADMMNFYNQYLGDPGYLPKDVARYEDATAASILSVARQRFAKDRRAVVYTIAGKKVINDVPRSPENTDAEVKLVDPYPKDFEAAQDWRKTAPSPGPNPKLNLPVPDSFALKNGLKVYLVEDHALPVMNATLLTLAGADANPSGKPGLSGFAARMLLQGTSRRSALQIAEDSDGIGANLRSDSDQDSAHASIGALSNYKDASLELLADITRHPAFKPEEIERIRLERLGEIAQEADDPFAALVRVGMKATFGERAYGYPPSGTTPSVKALSRDDLTDFWNRYYSPRNAALVLTGDVSASEARKLAETYFGDWVSPESAATPPIPPKPAALTRRIVIVDKPGSPQTALATFGIGLERQTPDYAPVMLMNDVFGGLFSSRLNMNLREKNGFTYGAFSVYRFHRGVGPFYAAALVRTDVTAEAAREMFTELNRIRTEPPNASEMQLAQDFALRSLPGRFDTVRATSQLIGDLFVFDLPADYYRSLPARFDSVTSAAVAKAAQKDLLPDQLIVIAVGDRTKIQPGLEKLNLGPIEIRDETGELIQSK